MNSANDRVSTTGDEGALSDFLRGAVTQIWRAARLPLVMVLAFLEPLVRLVLIGIAVLGVITAFVVKGSTATPAIPFWMMVCISAGCVLLIPIYHGLLRLLSK